MKIRNFTKIIILACLCLIINQGNLHAQKWSGVNGNEWLAGKYGQSWVRIGVNAKGVHRIALNSLPVNFQSANKANLQLWRRGTQVSIIKADDTEILFYGVPNDGSSDQLLYRLQTSRANPYFSTFSDEGAYFLTIGPSAGLRAASENSAVDNSIAPLQAHIKTDLKTYQNEYTHTTSISTRPATINSYFEEGKTATGTLMPIFNKLDSIHSKNPKPFFYASNYVPEPFSFQIKSPQPGTIPVIKILLSGRRGNAQVEVFVGKTPSTLRAVATVPTFDFNPKEYSFPLTNQDFDGNGGTLAFRSSVPNLVFFSVTYFTVTYNQLLDMQSLNSYEFNFPAANNGSKSRFTIANQSAGAKFYDISKVDQPRIILGNPSNMMITRDGNPLKLLATNQNIEVAAGKISSVTFEQTAPANFDYLIVTNETLFTSANQYAAYRKNTSPGQKYKPLVKKIKDIYNEFNYGEPSPVAIRRFVDYMISDGNKDKYLLLLGKSITRSDKVIKELPEEVPTVGFPGSDLLLVDGLKGVPDDVPAIPVGRISAISNQQVLDYLSKIITYESQNDVSWRKNVMHISGGKSQDEVNQFSNYLSSIGSSVLNPSFSGKVIQKAKTIPQDVIEQLSIAEELNGTANPDIKGLGMISYFGHGSTFRTDYNAGYISDPAKGYNNPGKYPVLFYNGCGVNNVFSDLFQQSVNTSASRPMSLDWLLTPNKGAIVVFGNDWDAYASTSNEYLDRLYPLIFKSDQQRNTIGKILQEVAAQTKIAKGYTYNPEQNARVAGIYDADRANVHQVLLQGDPALRILNTESALPVSLVSFGAKADGPNQVNVHWETASEKNNSHFVIERSYNSKNFEAIGRVEGKGDTESLTAYTFVDNKPLDGVSYYRLKQVDRDVVENGVTVIGDANYSSIVSLSREGTNALVISPNPAVDMVQIELNAPVGVKSFAIYDASGRLLKKDQKGTKVNLTTFSAGEYIIEITTTNGDVYTKKVVKR